MVCDGSDTLNEISRVFFLYLPKSSSIAFAFSIGSYEHHFFNNPDSLSVPVIFV